MFVHIKATCYWVNVGNLASPFKGPHICKSVKYLPSTKYFTKKKYKDTKKTYLAMVGSRFKNTSILMLEPRVVCIEVMMGGEGVRCTILQLYQSLP